ncbi:MAG: hypothetical protein QM497_04795 [Sulfurimonas sp.]
MSSISNSNLTYGEACIKEKESLELVKGKWTQKFHIHKKQSRMSRKDAGRYYNTKLFAYWMSLLNDDLSILRKSQIISLFMFGHAERYKLFKKIR